MERGEVTAAAGGTLGCAAAGADAEADEAAGARAIVARNCLCRDAVRSRPADIIRCRKENLGYGENYNAHPGRRESLDRFE